MHHLTFVDGTIILCIVALTANAIRMTVKRKRLFEEN